MGIQAEIPSAGMVVTGTVKERTEALTPDREPCFMAAAPIA